MNEKLPESGLKEARESGGEVFGFQTEIIGSSRKKPMVITEPVAKGRSQMNALGRQGAGKGAVKLAQAKSGGAQRQGSRLRQHQKAKSPDSSIPVLASQAGSAERAKFLLKVPGRLNVDSSLEIGKEARGPVAEQFVINWSETPLYKYYQQYQAILDVQKFQQIGHDPQSGYLAWDQRHFSNWEVEQLLGLIKAKYNEYESQKVHGPLYVKALVTLKHLFEEQGIDYGKLLKVRQLYGEISLENTLKLLIRCKILFASRMTLIDVFDTINRFQVSEKMLLDNNEKLKEEFAPEKGAPDEEKLGKVKEHALSLNSQFVAVAEELLAKVQILASGQHKSLKNMPFFFGGDQVTEQSVQRRVRLVQEALNLRWPIGAGEKIFNLQMRNKDVVYKEVMSKKIKLIEQVKLEQQLREQTLPLTLDEHNQYKNEHASPMAADEADRGALQDIRESAKKSQEQTSSMSRTEEPRAAESILREPAFSRTDATLSLGSPASNTRMQQPSSPGDAAGASRRFTSKTTKEPRPKKLAELQIISEDQTQDPPLQSASRADDGPLPPQDGSASQRGDDPQLDYQTLPEQSPPVDIDASVRRAAQQRASSQRRNDLLDSQRVIYESQPRRRLQRRKKGKAKRSVSPLDMIVGAEGFLPPFRQGDSLQQTAQSGAARAQYQTKDTSRRRKSPRRQGIQKYGGPGAIDQLKAQALLERMTFERKGATPKQPSRFSRRLNSTAGGESSLIYPAQASLDPSPARHAPHSYMPGSAHNDKTDSFSLPKSNFAARPETQGAGNSLFTRLHDRQANILKHRRIGTVASAFNGGNDSLGHKKHSFGSANPQQLFGKGGVKGLATLESEDQKQVIEEEPNDKDNEQQQNAAKQKAQENSQEDGDGVPSQNLQQFRSLHQDNKLDDVTDLAQERDIQPDLSGKIQKRIRERHQTVEQDAGEKPGQRMTQLESEKTRAARAATSGQLKRLVLRPYNRSVMQSFFENQRTLHGAEADKQEQAQAYNPLSGSLVSPFRGYRRVTGRRLAGQSVNTAMPAARPNGHLNRTLVPPLLRDQDGTRDRRLANATADNQRSSSVDSQRMENTARSHRPSQIGAQKSSGLAQTEGKRHEYHTATLGTRRDYDELPDESSMVSITDRIFALEKRLEDMGVQIPAHQYDLLNKLRDEARAVKYKLPRLQAYRPPHGGHTKNSFIRQEMDNLARLNQQLALNVAPVDVEGAAQSESLALQAQHSQDARNARFQPPYAAQTAREKPNNSLSSSPARSTGPNDQDEHRATQTARALPKAGDTPRRADQSTVIGEAQLESTHSSGLTRAGPAATMPPSVAQTMYHSHNKSATFSTHLWPTPNQIVFEDNRLQATSIRQEREARVLMHNLERQLKKVEDMKEKKLKEQMAKFYLEHFGIVVSEQTQFMLPVDELRSLFIRKANAATLNKAATRIQRWYKAHYRVRKAAKDREAYRKAVILLQRAVRRWKATVRDPAKLKERQEVATKLIQKFLRGYQARRKTEYWVMDAKADRLHDYWHPIDVVTRGHFQRRVRKVWLAYKERKAAKAKKKAAAGKKKKGRKSVKPAAAAAAKPTPLSPARKPDGGAGDPAGAGIVVGGPEDGDGGEDGEGAPVDGGEDDQGDPAAAGEAGEADGAGENAGEGDADGAAQEKDSQEGSAKPENEEGKEGAEEKVEAEANEGEAKPAQEEGDDKDEPPREAPPKRDGGEDSDDMARATGQETVMKLAAEGAEVEPSIQNLGTTFDESINRALDDIETNKEAQASICAQCKQERNITDLKDLDASGQGRPQATEVLQIPDPAGDGTDPGALASAAPVNRVESVNQSQAEADKKMEVDADGGGQPHQQPSDVQSEAGRSAAQKPVDEVLEAQTGVPVPKAPDQVISGTHELAQEAGCTQGQVDDQEQDPQPHETEVTVLGADEGGGINPSLEVQALGSFLIEQDQLMVAEAPLIHDDQTTTTKNNNDESDHPPQEATSQHTGTKENAQSQRILEGASPLVAGKYATTHELGVPAIDQQMDHSLMSGRGHERRSAVTEAEMFDKQGVEGYVTENNTKTSHLEEQLTVPVLSKSGNPLHIQFDGTLPNFGNQLTERTREGPNFGGSEDQWNAAQRDSQFPTGRPFVQQNQSLDIQQCSIYDSSLRQEAPQLEAQPSHRSSQHTDELAEVQAKGYVQQILEPEWARQLHEGAKERPQILLKGNEECDMSNNEYTQRGILVSPTFNESRSEVANALGENVVLTTPNRGLNVTMLESFGQNYSSKAISQTKSDVVLDKDQSRDLDGNVLLGPEEGTGSKEDGRET